jgi:ribonuclease HI
MTFQPTRIAGFGASPRALSAFHDADRPSTGPASGASTGPILVWTDGARIGDPTGGPGAWAYVAKWGDRTRCRSGGVRARVTNVQMEMIAAIQALRSIKRRDIPTVLHTDLEMLAKGAHEWLPKWRNNGWKSSNRKPVANRDLWEALAELMDERAPGAQITIIWVRSHSGVVENEMADAMAEAAARVAAKAPSASSTASQFDRTLGLMVRAEVPK